MVTHTHRERREWKGGGERPLPWQCDRKSKRLKKYEQAKVNAKTEQAIKLPTLLLLLMKLANVPRNMHKCECIFVHLYRNKSAKENQ